MQICKISSEQTMLLRQRVLWPNETTEFCRVDGDEDASHFGAFINDNLVCVASVYLTQGKARLRKFATDTDYQNQGVGSEMLNHIIQSLKSTEANLFWCDARESALGFYRRFGMTPYGVRFYKQGIPYFKMKLAL
ncbi:GNAT family N-acetyltransferase [Pseudoalteromonas sp. SG45-5]|nr:GNAT family N-acetyltransferase [Pseudoalteromonas sp. SG45-5]MBB1394820.1 GNAT family N-acetyltransferase [Pseudoalteromonas sp. SG44-4]